MSIIFNSTLIKIEALQDGQLNETDVSLAQKRIRNRKYRMNETFGVTEKETQLKRLNIDMVKMVRTYLNASFLFIFSPSL